MTQRAETRNMALFCDFENIALGVRDANYAQFDIGKVIERLLLKGNIVVKKAYCDWARYKEFKAAMHESSFELIEIPHVRQSGKNSADIRMVVDALDLCYTKGHVDTFVIISGDSDFSPLVIALFAFGAFALLLYTWPLKYFALGELFIFLIWGPIMITGVYTVLARGWTPNIWNVALAGIPFGLSVASINVGKHIDKLNEDRIKGVGTLPVRLGEKTSRYTAMAVLVIIYLVILYLIFVPRYFTPVMLVVFFAAKRLLLALRTLSRPRPNEPPEGYSFWPTWFSAFIFNHNRMFGGLFILGLVVDTLCRLFLGSFWPMR